MTKRTLITTLATSGLIVASAGALAWANPPVSMITRQRAQLQRAALREQSGPQSPRDLEQRNGDNPTVFGDAPNRQRMNLCNIHIHDGAEHRGGEFKTYAGDGDGSGFGSGYLYSGSLSNAELKPVSMKSRHDSHRTLPPGSTIEIHFVYSTARVKPGPTLASCQSPQNRNPQLRVEAVIAVLVNNRNAADFVTMAQHRVIDGYHAAPNIPDNLGRPVVYSGSTTGPSYNMRPSPYQVTWSVRPRVIKVDVLSVDQWLKANAFAEEHAHGVRNLIINPALLSPIRASN